MTNISHVSRLPWENRPVDSTKDDNDGKRHNNSHIIRSVSLFRFLSFNHLGIYRDLFEMMMIDILITSSKHEENSLLKEREQK